MKDTFIEATAERESPEDTALIASIFSYIAEVHSSFFLLPSRLFFVDYASCSPPLLLLLLLLHQVVDKDHSPCEIPDKIRVALQNAAMADHMRPQLHLCER